MTRVLEVQTNFQSGEIDSKVSAQTDLKLYTNGLKRMRNLARLAGGGVERRPGSLDLAALPGRARLVDFEFSADQRYVVAFSNGSARVFDTEGALLTTLTGCPWDETTMREMSYSQNADIMILSHANFIRELTRTGASTFVLNTFAFDQSQGGLKVYQPYYKFADDSVTMTPSASTGNITLTASGTAGWGGFVAGHVGTRFRIYDAEVEVTSVVSGTVANATVHGELKGKLDIDALKSKKGSPVVEVQHLYHGLATGTSIVLSGANDVGHNAAGTGGIPATELVGGSITVIDEHNYSFPVATSPAESEDGGGPNIEFSCAGVATRQWLEASVSPVRGYPGACCFHEGRLWFAGTPSQPDGYFGSDALKHTRFDVGKGYDGQSVQGAAGLENLSAIRHLISNGDLQIFTPTTEGIFVTRSGEAITPSNQRVLRQSISGASYVMPQVFDNATIFAQENGLSVSELVYDERKAGYAATPISTIATHLLKSGVVDSAVTAGSTSRAEQYAFFVTAEGGLVVFHSMRAENIAGWGLWTIGGASVHSVCSVGPDVFVAVQRGSDYRLYKLQPSETFYSLDGAVEHTAASPGATSWTLDPRVRGRTLAVRSERGFHGLYAIPANGTFTTPFPCQRLLVGDPYYYELETLPPRVELANGARDRLKKRILRAIIAFEETESAIVNDQPVLVRMSGGDPAAAITPFEGDYEFRQLGFERSPTIVVTQEEPTFARILGLTLEVKV